ncbi:MAG: CDP-glucose 4,6-dehydratase [Gammaproteobacteria bacterium]|nr:CDP-glucose 4,6-dehydratase [Gammaproteobacteria bacterium]
MNRTPQPTDTLYFGDVFRGQKVLITGNTGFKGSWLTTLLLRLGARVYGLADNVPTEPSLFREIGLESQLEAQHWVDIRDLDAVREVVESVQPDFLFHLAAQAILLDSYRDPVRTFTTNVLGTTHVLEVLRLWGGPCTAVIITSDKCYENVEQVWGYRESDRLGGKDVYSGSKGASELIFYSYFHSFFKNSTKQLRLATARAGNVIGGGDWAKDRIVVDCMQAWNLNEQVQIRSPYATRPWQHVLEPLSGYLRIAQVLQQDPRLNGESFNLGPPGEQDKTVLDLIAALSRYWHFATPGDAYEYDEQLRPQFDEAKLLRLNCDKAEAYLGWLPTLNFRETVRMVSEWYYAFYREKSDMLGHTVADIDSYLRHATAKGHLWTSAEPRSNADDAETNRLRDELHTIRKRQGAA